MRFEFENKEAVRFCPLQGYFLILIRTVGPVSVSKRLL